ncbi:toprim domain-containing protein [Dyadobacter sp. BHUBP1]|uniref:toprim domain-containing protein n=1 Tax=Dyadobacter sp. BHUBP1 TaxID=3424178 RepID=UPI003D33E46A
MVRKQDFQGYIPKRYQTPVVKPLPLSPKALAFFKSRGIAERTLEFFQINESKEWMQEDQGVKAGITACINFNYYLGKELINVKFRASGKRFRLYKDAKLIFFNLNQIRESEECAIQEGELDTMSAYQCNVFKSVSVPNGASKGTQKLEYLDNCWEYFENKKKIVVATDDDEPGLRLRDELIRRLGRERCWIVSYPPGCKDTNEVLMKLGEDAVRKMYREAQQVPLEGIFTGDDISDRVIEIYNNGFPKGLKVGFVGFDDHWSCRYGEVTVVTGIPGSGKSEFVDQLMVRLAARFGSRCGIFSPEHQPPELHAGAIIAKFVGDRFVGNNSMNQHRLNQGLSFLNDHFFFMKVSEIDATIDGILQKARELIVRKGINILLIDPYNYIEHKIPKGYTETQYISELMTKVVNFAKANLVHIFLIAHPVKIAKDKAGKYAVATMYDIAGSAHFFNKTDNGISVYRDFETNIVTVYIQKIKFKFIGRPGSCSFKYDMPTGRYTPEGYGYVSELELLLRQSEQTSLDFSDLPHVEPISSPKVREPTSFDYEPRDDAPF